MEKVMVQCKRCRKEVTIDVDKLVLDEGFTLHYDDEGTEYFLCSDCEETEHPYLYGDYDIEGSKK